MPSYSAQFAGRFLDNIQAVLERDVNTRVAALDSELALFSDEERQMLGFRVPTAIATNFPALYLEPAQSDLSQSADDSRIEQEHEFVISLAVTGPDDYTLQRRVITYVTAIDQALRRASDANMLGSAPTSAVRKPVWEVTQHRYSVTFNVPGTTIYRRNAQLVLKIQMLER